MTAAVFGFRWEKAEASEPLSAFATLAVQKLKEIVKESGSLVTYTYANFADKDSPVFEGLSDATRERLKAVSEKYDPSAVFQKQVSGFKLK